jgi:hypothetical protein
MSSGERARLACWRARPRDRELSLPDKSNDRDYAFVLSASEIIEELPKLSETERRAIREGLLEIANQDSDVALCNQTALDGALMLDGKENE